MKKYKFGIVCGRFQVFHKGHRSIIDEALNQCEKVAVFIGSAQKQGTKTNPFSYDFRKQMIEKVYDFELADESVFNIYPIADLTDGSDVTGEWGRYLLDTVRQVTGMEPDAIFSGSEDIRGKWFYDDEQIEEVFVDRAVLPISATGIRKEILRSFEREEAVYCRAMVNNVMKNIPQVLWRYIPKMHKILSQIEMFEQLGNDEV